MASSWGSSWGGSWAATWGIRAPTTGPDAWAGSWAQSWGDSWARGGVTPPAAESSPVGGGGGFYRLFALGSMVKEPRRKKQKPKQAEQDKRAAALAVERAVAEHWDKQLDEIERSVRAVLRQERVRVQEGKEREFRAYLERAKAAEVRAREQAVMRAAKLEEATRKQAEKEMEQHLKVARQRRNNRLAMLLVHLDS